MKSLPLEGKFLDLKHTMSNSVCIRFNTHPAWNPKIQQRRIYSGLCAETSVTSVKDFNWWALNGHTSLKLPWWLEYEGIYCSCKGCFEIHSCKNITPLSSPFSGPISAGKEQNLWASVHHRSIYTKINLINHWDLICFRDLARKAIDSAVDWRWNCWYNRIPAPHPPVEAWQGFVVL